MEELSSDVLINVISHLNVVSLSRLSSTNRRLCYLVDQFRSVILGPELVACSSHLLPSNHNRSEGAAQDVEDAAVESRSKRARLAEGGGQCAHNSTGATIRAALEDIRSRPNVAFAFYTPQGLPELAQQLDAALPDDCVVLGSMTSFIQTNCRDQVESSSNFSVMLGCFRDRASFLPFDLSSNALPAPAPPNPAGSARHLHSLYPVPPQPLQDPTTQTPIDKLQHMLTQATPHSESVATYWKLFILYVCGDGYFAAEEFLAALQAHHPHASIIGGICDGGHIRLSASERMTRKAKNDAAFAEIDLTIFTNLQLQKIILDYTGVLVREVPQGHTERSYFIQAATDAIRGKTSTLTEVGNGIFGVAIGGTVPVRAIVSRGVRSLTSGLVGLSESQWKVSESSFVRPGDSTYPFRSDSTPLKPVHMIQKVMADGTTDSIDALQFLMQVAASVDRPEFIGLKRDDGEGFELSMISQYTAAGGCLSVMADASEEAAASHVGSYIDLFKLDGRACLEDMNTTLMLLKEQIKDEKVLGGIMFSCAGRGPTAGGFLEEEMADAKRFFQHFPKQPCVGFYAGGEIGPKALVGNKRIFQTGKVAVQGFTAVFAVFIVPDIEADIRHLDDSTENILHHMEQRLTRTVTTPTTTV